jgi:NitT/TauT family transport system ATP-binding protein
VFVEGPDPQQAVVFQDYLLFPWKTVRGNITFGPKLRGVDRKASEKISCRYIDLMGLTGFEDRYPHELSGGMQQRVAIARALANDPKVLLMDEPFGSLDALTREVMQVELLKIWRADRCTVLFVTHSINEAVFLSDRVVVMTKRPGRIKTVVDINLDRPRTQDMQLSDRFRNYEMTLKRMVWEEV